MSWRLKRGKTPRAPTYDCSLITFSPHPHRSYSQWVKNPDRLDMNRKEKNDRTPLHLAAISGSIEALRAMLTITEDAPTSFKEKKHEKLRQSRILNVSATEVRNK